MQEIIKVTSHEGRQVVNARDLHAFLEVGKHFKDWIPAMLAYGFEENKDYTVIEYDYLGNVMGAPKNGQSENQHVAKRDYALTLDTAKEIAMIQRTEKGKQARQYFIECEKQLRQVPSLSVEDMIIMNATAMKEQRLRLASLETKVAEVDARTQTRPDYFTLVGYATLNRIPKFSLNTASAIGRKATQRCKEVGVEMDSVPDPRFGRVNLYPKFILDEIFKANAATLTVTGNA